MSSRSYPIPLAVVAGHLLSMLALSSSMPQCFAQCSTCDTLRFVGEARDSAGIITLTPSRPASRGAVWTVRRHAIARGFTASFSYRVSDTAGRVDPSGRSGGDGFAFVVQDDTPAAIGGPGYALGYAGTINYPGIARSLAVEFDFWDDTGLPEAPDFVDFASWHVAFHSAGSVENSAAQGACLAVNADVPRTDDGVWHRAVIRYEPGDSVGPKLDLFIDSARVLSWSGRIDTLSGLDSGMAWLGITASTMSAWQRHQVTDVVFAPMADDTVRWNRCQPDTVTVPVHDTVIVVRIDTVRTRDTLRVFISRPPRMIVLRDTLYIRDTLVVLRTDSVVIIRSDTLRRFDTCFIIRDTCWSALDTICGGQLRQMVPQTWVQGIRSIDPNPATGITTIRYTLGDRGLYKLLIHDMQGRELWKQKGVATEGEYETSLDTGNWPRGLYVVRLIGRAGAQTALLSVRR
jgi:hypothetical protein